MIKHIVLWRFKEEAGGQKKEQNIQKAISSLRALPGAIPQIGSFEVSRNIDSSGDAVDLGLYSSFATLQDLKTYQAHPDHVAVAAFLKNVWSEKRVFDYEL
jgi:Stress responsive A/B Barrel Domain